MDKKANAQLSEIEDIMIECEMIQASNESAYTKEQAKISAYDRIKELIGIRVVV